MSMLWLCGEFSNTLQSVGTESEIVMWTFLNTYIYKKVTGGFMPQSNNPKRENLLNLALDASQQELEQSPNLQTGYNQTANTWELIIRYSTDLVKLRQEYPQISLIELLNGYAIAIVPQQLMEEFTERPEIEYIEKPKRLFFTVDQGIRASCIHTVQATYLNLSGKGILCGIADSGIDWRHPDFCNPDGTTRIVAIWDQTLPADAAHGMYPPTGYERGVEFTREQINAALKERPPEVVIEDVTKETPVGERLQQYVRLTGDSSGHGTHVAGIMAGNGRASAGRYRGVAYESSLLVVKLGVPREGGFPSTVELMMAVDYMMRKARELNLPISLNLSFGNNYGSHSGASLIETYLNSLSGYWKNVISVGTGNEGTASVHTSGQIETGNSQSANTVQFVVSTYESFLSLQIWKSYSDEIDIQLVHPSGLTAGPIQRILGTQRFRMQQTEILLYYGEPSPYSVYQEIFIEFLPTNSFIDSGVWEIRLIPRRIVNGNFDMWLPGGGILNRGTGFLYPVEDTTLTIPSTAEKVISVAAYNSRTNQTADFSGRGYTRVTRQIKPDLAAPGVGIVSAVPGGGYGVKSGTSMATPFVAGSAALLMQWGIVEGNDPYLYGEKIKAYLIKGASPLTALAEYPNPQIGWGVICVENSLPL